MSETKTDILTDIRAFLTRFIAFPDEAYSTILAVWILHTWTFDAFRVTPYVYLNSAERGSGKTLTLELLNELCRNATMAADISAASLYRFIEAARPTMLVDEVDAIWSGAKNQDLRGVLNSGYKHNGSVMRAAGGTPSRDDYDDGVGDGGIIRYSTFCPKILAGIDNGMMPDTIADRSIALTLKRANAAQMQAIEDFYIEDEEDHISELTARMQTWAEENQGNLRDPERRPARLDKLGPRQNEIARPLLTIAAVVGGGWYTEVRDALLHLLSADDFKLSPQATVLLRVREWFNENPEIDRIATQGITELTGHNGKQIGVWMNAYGIKSFTGTFAGRNLKGYRKSDFQDAFERYLPADEEGS